MKPWWASSTIIVNLVLLGLSIFWPDLAGRVCGNPELAVQILALTNILLRIKTKQAVIGLALLISACSSVPQKLETDVYYRRDLPFCVAGYGCFEGVTTLPAKSSYTFEIEPKGEADIDLMVVTTCHRNKTFEKTSSGWFIFKNKRRFQYVYTPNPAIEGDGDCHLVLNTYEKEKGRHAWAVILFEHSQYTLPFKVFCDGDLVQSSGVAGCQSKHGLKQGLEFPVPVMIEPHFSCVLPKKVGAHYEWPIDYKECAYTIRSQDGRLGYLFTMGYRGELVREQQ